MILIAALARRCRSALGRLVLGSSLLLGATSCAKAPMDAILAESELGPAPTEDDCALGLASVTGLVRLRLQSSQQCIAVGPETFPQGILETRMVDDCATNGELFVPSAVGDGSFEFRSQTTLKMLDIYTGAMLDGTHAVLYDSTSNSNQRFYLEQRGVRVFAMRAAHVVSDLKCLTQSIDLPAVPEIQPCIPTPQQNWQFVPASCEP